MNSLCFVNMMSYGQATLIANDGVATGAVIVESLKVGGVHGVGSTKDAHVQSLVLLLDDFGGDTILLHVFVQSLASTTIAAIGTNENICSVGGLVLAGNGDRLSVLDKRLDRLADENLFLGD